MGKPQRIVKLYQNVDNDFRVTSKTTVAGATVIGDYTETDGQQTLRVLVFERPEPPQAPKSKPQAKPRVRRTKAQIAEDARQAQANAAAQGVGVTHGT